MGEDGAGGARFLIDSITQDFLKGQYQEIFIEVFFFLELYFTVRGSRSYLSLTGVHDNDTSFKSLNNYTVQYTRQLFPVSISNIPYMEVNARFRRISFLVKVSL
jgi:hypothetical protein